MSFLVDTNVLSELRKGNRCDRGVAEWFEAVDDEDLFVSVMSLGEIRCGIERVRRRDPESAARLASWLRDLTEHHADRTVPVDHAIAQEWGRMNVPDQLPVIDSLLAATARVRGLQLVTRNTKDLTGTGVDCLNPFTG